MKKYLFLLISFFFLTINWSEAQIKAPKFGKGIQFEGADSSYYLKVGFRFQTLFNNQWKQDGNGDFSDYDANFLIRRSRLKFDGFVVDPRVKIKAELSLSNRDLSGGIAKEFGEAANLILDASVSYNFFKNWTLQFGQRKLPGNRERIISSANLALVDRSRLNSRYTLDRDMGFQLMHHHNLGGDFIVKETFAISQGEGKNVTAAHFGGFGYTIKAEIFPFGEMKSKGAYVGGATKFEEEPKLALAVSYDINKNSVRERGRKGSFIINDSGDYIGKDLNSFFVDMMFKYQNIYIMAEYATRATADELPTVMDDEGNLIGTFYTGKAFNVAAGINLPSNLELSGRYTFNNPDDIVSRDEKEYTIGLSKYIVGHKLKIQTDFTTRKVTGGSDIRLFRFQTEVHF